MGFSPSKAALYIEQNYGTRAKVAVNSLGTRPIELLEDESLRLEELIDALEEDEEANTAQRPVVRKYFEVMEDVGVVDFEDGGYLLNPDNRELKKNGASYDEIEELVEIYADRSF